MPVVLDAWETSLRWLKRKFDPKEPFVFSCFTKKGASNSWVQTGCRCVVFFGKSSLLCFLRCLLVFCFFPKQHLKNVEWWGLGEVPIGAINSKKTTLLSSGRLLLPLLSKVSRDEQVCIFWPYRSFCASWGLHWWFGFKIRRPN